LSVDRARLAELAALALWDQGATAVSEHQEADGTTVLSAGYPTAEASRRVLTALAPEWEATVREVDDRQWQDAWKAHAQPVAVGERLVVAPAWREVEVGEGRLVLSIDPGACFGSGTHPSTRLLLARLAGDDRVRGATVLDVGTGSGILAVAAARLGASAVTAVDIDPDSVVVASANAARNHVAEVVEVSTDPLVEVPGSFALVLVNVTAGVHAQLGPDVVRHLAPGGQAWLAGLLPGQWQHVTGAYAGAELVEVVELDGWEGAVLARA
jgi:ribosomal protein L11 methyltransferase